MITDGRFTRSGRTPALAWTCAVVLAAASSGCAHRSVASRTGALADFARSLPICTGAPNVLTVAETRRTWWRPGTRLAVHGHLAVVAWGPPCEGNAPPTSGAHCSRSWTLWDTGQHPGALFDQSPTDAGALTLTASAPARASALTLPALVEGDEGHAFDLEVTVTGEIPSELCEPTDIYPGMPEFRPNRVDCATISFDVYPLAATEICRSPGALPGDMTSATYPPCTGNVTEGAATLDTKSALRAGDAIAIRGVLTPDAGECTEMACIQRDVEHRRERRLACCNGCGGWLLLRDKSDPRGMRERARDAFIAAVQEVGQNRPLRWAAKDCAVPELFARAQPEVVVSGVVRDWALAEIPGTPRARTSLIDQARICTTGAWSERQVVPPPPTDGPWVPSGKPLEIESPPAARPPAAP